MRHSNIRFLWVVTLVISIVISSRLAVQAHSNDEGQLAEHPGVAAALKVLDAWIQATVAEREQPGLSIGIVYDQSLI